MSAIKRYSTSTHLGSIFYYDGLTRNPHRWLASGPPQASQSLCLYSLKVPIGKHDVGNTAAELVVNFLRSETEEEAWAVTKLQERLFPGCLIHIPVAQWFRTYESGSASQSPDERPYRSVMDDYLQREKATKSVLFGALHLRSSFLSPFRSTLHNPEFISYDDPLYGAVSGLIEQRIRKLEDSVFPLDGLESAALTF